MEEGHAFRREPGGSLVTGRVFTQLESHHVANELIDLFPW